MATLIVKHPNTSDSNLLTPPFLPLLLLFLYLSSLKSTSNRVVVYMHFYTMVTLIIKHPFQVTNVSLNQMYARFLFLSPSPSLRLPFFMHYMHFFIMVTLITILWVSSNRHFLYKNRLRWFIFYQELNSFSMVTLIVKHNFSSDTFTIFRSTKLLTLFSTLCLPHISLNSVTLSPLIQYW